MFSWLSQMLVVVQFLLVCTVTVTIGRFLFFKHLAMLLEYLQKEFASLKTFLLISDQFTDEWKVFVLELGEIDLNLFQNFLGLCRYSGVKLQLFNLLARLTIFLLWLLTLVCIFPSVTLIDCLAFLCNYSLAFILAFTSNVSHDQDRPLTRLQ